MDIVCYIICGWPLTIAIWQSGSGLHTSLLWSSTVGYPSDC